MILRYDPYQVFRNSKTPAGLYARQKWLGEAETTAWHEDFEKTVKTLFADQLSNGSWQQSTVATISHLFGLHLTVRSTDNQVNSALNWLLEKISLNTKGIRAASESDYKDKELTGLPFISSRPAMFLTGATLFLASIFDRHNDPAVLVLYRWLSQQGFSREYLRTDIKSMHNIFRAWIVHPVFANDRVTGTAVEMFADVQTEKGDWGDRLPFHQTLNALAHLQLPQAEYQLEKAFERLVKTQKPDGTWRRLEPEWHSFLSIHALKNKNLL
jgi:hypothetical protein